MLKRLKPKSEFSRNVLTLMIGTSIAQAIPIAISPILTRLYTPEDFGILALFVAITSILSIIVTGQYDLAILLPKSEKSAFNIVALTITINILISFIIFLVIVVFHSHILNLLGNNNLGGWLYFIPISIFLMGLIQTLNYWLNAQKQYKQLSINKVIQSTANSSSNLLLGFQKFGHDGLIISQLLAQSIVVAILIKKTYKNKYIRYINKLKIIALVKRYIKFPKITMFTSLFSMFSNQFPIFMITYFFTTKDVGYYSFAIKIISMPISLVSNSLYQVFFQAFTKEKNKEQFYKNKFLKINVMFLPLFIILWFILPSLFSFVFGENWIIAGKYAQILLPLLYLKFISNLFTTTTYLYYEKQFENLLLSIIISIVSIIALIIGGFLNDVVLGLEMMVVFNSLVIFYKLSRSLKFVKGDIKNVTNP